MTSLMVSLTVRQKNFKSKYEEESFISEGGGGGVHPQHPPRRSAPDLIGFSVPEGLQSGTPPSPGISMTFLLGSPYPLEIWYLLGTVIKFSQGYSCLNCKPWLCLFLSHVPCTWNHTISNQMTSWLPLQCSLLSTVTYASVNKRSTSFLWFV